MGSNLSPCFLIYYKTTPRELSRELRDVVTYIVKQLTRWCESKRGVEALFLTFDILQNHTHYYYCWG